MPPTQTAAKPETKPRSVADAIAETMAAWGVRHAFGIPGNDVLELIRACEEHGIEFTLAKSEPAAGFMADAVYQLTGIPAALIPAMGPGMANAMAGIGGALMERSAMLVLTGDIGSDDGGIYTHQVFDHIELARPLAKHADRLNPQRAAQQVAKALDIATSWPPGPVILNCPADFSTRATDHDTAFQPRSSAQACIAAEDAEALRQRLAQAQRPLALIGRGALDTKIPEALQSFLEAWNMPFLASYKAKGIVDEYHDLCLGAVGLSPVVDAENMKIVDAADHLVLVGFDPIELRNAWTDAWDDARPVTTIDRTAQTHRVFPVDREAIGDMPAILRQLTPDAPAANSPTAGDEDGWSEGQLAEFRGAVAHIVRPRETRDAISPAALFGAVSDMVAEDWILTVDVGAHRILANHAIRCRTPGQLVQSNGLCCMGYAIPAAIGAGLAAPEKKTIALVGDGCALMTIGELAIAAERDLPLVVIVINDAALALIKLKQSKMQMARRAVDFSSPRYDLIAQGFGAKGVRVDSIQAFSDALAEAVSEHRLTVIDAVIDPAEYWEQM